MTENELGGKEKNLLLLTNTFHWTQKRLPLTFCSALSILEAKAIADFREVMSVYNYITVIRLGRWGPLLLLLLPVCRRPAPCHLPTCLTQCVDISRLVPSFIF